MIENEPSGSTCSVWLRVAVGRAEALLGGEDVGAGQVRAQLVGDELRGVRPVGVRVDGGADAGDEPVELVDGAGLRGASWPTACGPIDAYVQCQFSADP